MAMSLGRNGVSCDTQWVPPRPLNGSPDFGNARREHQANAISLARIEKVLLGDVLVRLGNHGVLKNSAKL
jgi:hypothetical protein